jgi:hypothetical protein
MRQKNNPRGAAEKAQMSRAAYDIAMAGAFMRGTKGGPGCGTCRHSETREVGKAHEIVCTLNLVYERGCKSFKDARKQSSIQPHER